MTREPALDDRGLPGGWPLDPSWEVTPREVAAMRRGDESMLLLDCRTPGEHEAARIEGATLVPLQQLPARADELAAHRDARVIVYCHHGRRSLKAAALLRQQGFTDVRSMAGGIDVWSRDVDQTVPRY